LGGWKTQNIFAKIHLLEITANPQPSWRVELAERRSLPENLDALVFGGLSFPDHYSQDMDTSAAVFEKIVKHHWAVEARYNGEIKRWWEGHRDSFQR